METVQCSFEDFFWMPRTSFHSFGFDPLEEPKELRRRLLLRLYFFACLASHAYCTYTMFKGIYEWSDISLVMRYATLLPYLASSGSKFLTLLLHRRAIQRLCAELAELYPQSTSERLAHRVNEHYWSRTLRILTVAYFASVGLLVMGPLLQSLTMYALEIAHHGLRSANYPYLHLYPLPEQDSVWKYTVNYLVEILHALHMVPSNFGTDLCIVCLVMQLCMHFDYIARTLEEYEPDWRHDIADRQFLKKMAEKHQKVLNLNMELNRIFSGSLLINVITTAGVLCFLAVYILMKGMNLEGFSYMVFISTATAQFYLICYYDERMISLSTDIAYTAYNHSWYNGSPAYKKQLLVIMIRAQRPAELSASGYLPISLETFQEVMNLTYRVFTLIRTMIE